MSAPLRSVTVRVVPCPWAPPSWAERLYAVIVDVTTGERLLGTSACEDGRSALRIARGLLAAHEYVEVLA